MMDSDSDKSSILEEAKTDVRIKQWRIPSATGIGDLAIKAWMPAEAPKLILQLVHGMAEHIDRYDAFARVMAAQSMLVVGFDLPGHGQSAPDEQHLGFFAEKDGWQKVIDDIRSVSQEARSLAVGKPFVLFGHSMGSSLAIRYAIDHGQSLSGLVLSGVVVDNPMLPLARFLAARSIRRNGYYHRDTTIDKMMHQGFLQRVDKPKSANEWLSRDPSIVMKYDADPLCGFPFTAAGYRDLFGLLTSISGKQWGAKIPRHLPVLLLSGEDDPVGAFGQGPKQVFSLLKKAGHLDVSMILYPGGRHENLNETNKETVFHDVSTTIHRWMHKGGPT